MPQAGNNRNNSQNTQLHYEGKIPEIHYIVAQLKFYLVQIQLLADPFWQ